MVDATDISAGVESLSNVRRSKGILVTSLIFIIALSLVALTGTWDWFANRFFGFFPLLIGLFVLGIHPVVRVKAAVVLSGLADWLARRGAFVSNPEEEAPKFALIRIVFGLFMIERAFWVISYLEPSDWGQPSIWLTAMMGLLCGVLVTAGLLTQYTLVYLIRFSVADGRHTTPHIHIGKLDRSDAFSASDFRKRRSEFFAGPAAYEKRHVRVQSHLSVLL